MMAKVRRLAAAELPVVAAVAVLSLVVAGCGSANGEHAAPRDVAVPRVVGEQVATAKAEINAAHLKMATRYTMGGPPRHRPRSGTVLLEQPHPGANVARNTVVHLTVQR
jgi:beta-lactam-binding protein with PASTA domain